MIRPSSTISDRCRPADTDATVMALSGLVLLLLVLLAFVSGLALWQWRQASTLRGQVAQQPSFGGPSMAFDLGPAGGELEVLIFWDERQAASLVGVTAAGPFEALPALAVTEQGPFPDVPPGGAPIVP